MSEQYISQLNFMLNFIDRVSEFGDFNASIPNKITSDPKCRSSSTEPNKRTSPTPSTVIVRSPRPLHEIQDPLTIHTDEEFLTIYRFTKIAVKDILDMISYGLTKYDNRGHPVSPIVQLLITLKFLASGQQKNLGNNLVSAPTVSRIIRNVTTLLSHLKPRFIQNPSENDKNSLTSKFYEKAGFPDVLGCVGSTHIAIRCPRKAIANHYMNQNGFHSFQIMMICGPDNEFLELISRWPGGTHESKIFNISEFYQKLEYQHIEGVLLADNNYMSSRFLMTPVTSPSCSSEVEFNKAHQATYNTPPAIELWKRRFKCLQCILHNKEETVQTIINATAVLHNYALRCNVPLPAGVASETIASIKPKDGFTDRQHITVVHGLEASSDQKFFIEKHFQNG